MKFHLYNLENLFLGYLRTVHVIKQKQKRENTDVKLFTISPNNPWLILKPVVLQIISEK
jgi:hypothetical protein